MRVLNLSWNGFAFDGTSAIAVALSKNKTLHELDLSSNRLHAEALARLMRAFKFNNSLVKIWVRLRLQCAIMLIDK